MLLIKNRKVKKYLLLLPLLGVVAIIFIFVWIKLGKDVNNDINKNQWNYHNYGQKVNGVSGKKDIDINLENAWNYTKGSSEVVIGIVDTGVDVSCKSISVYQNGEESYDFYNDDTSIFDKELYDYHGTYLAMAMNSNDEEISGVAPGITVFPVKFMEGTSGDSDDAAEALEYACESGCKIVNCSWALTNENENILKVIEKYPDVLFVCAAGNEGINLDEKPVYPAQYSCDYDNVISVGAVTSKGQLYEGSGYGSSVDIVSPGENILVKYNEENSGYVEGTSVATAQVSAIAGLMLSANKDLSASEMKDIIVSTVTVEDCLDGRCNSSGIVNAGEAVKMAAEQ